MGRTAVVAFDLSLPVLGLPGSAVLRLAHEAGCGPWRRPPTAATAQGTLVPRGQPGDLLHDADATGRTHPGRLVREGW
ncbi:MAG: hypothetical protein R2719_04115 [Micropruina sp.]